jgi:hypothetical protein
VRDLSTLLTRIFHSRAQLIARNLFAVAGGIVSIVTLVVMLTSAGSRHWVKDHPYWMFGGFVVAIVTILVLLNVMQDISARYSELLLLQRADDLRPTDQDKRAMGIFLAHMPPEGILVRWLKKRFIPSAIPLAELGALNEVSQHLSSDPDRFNDPAAAARYLMLTTAVGVLNEKLQRWTSLEAGHTQRIIPIEWEQGVKYQRAVNEIEDARNSLISAYDEFLRTCHQRGIQPS